MKKINLVYLLLILGIIFAVIYSGGEAVAPNDGLSDLIVLESPAVGEVIVSPLKITGRARGYWFFEASFPVFLTDWDGRIIAQGNARALSDWMTEDFVPFEAVLNFERPADIAGVKNVGSLILKKDNPSGLPANDNALEIQVKF